MALDMIFHPRYDNFCVEKCLTKKELSSTERLIPLHEGDSIYTNECPEVSKDHPESKVIDASKVNDAF